MAQTPPSDEPHTITASSGAFAIGTNGASVGYGLEYRFPSRGRGLPHLGRLHPVPAVGAMMTSRHAVYAYAGLRADLALSDRWSLTPGFAVGTYAHGQDVDLGGGLEFRSDLQVARSFSSGWKVGLAIQHMSNGRVYNKNPGANSLTLIVRF